MPAGLTAIGKYQVVDRLGRGGMGTVYLARDPALDRLIAIKVLSGDLVDDRLQRVLNFLWWNSGSGKPHRRVGQKGVDIDDVSGRDSKRRPGTTDYNHRLACR